MPGPFEIIATYCKVMPGEVRTQARGVMRIDKLKLGGQAAIFVCASPVAISGGNCACRKMSNLESCHLRKNG